MNTLSASLVGNPDLVTTVQSIFNNKGYKFFDSASLYDVNIIGVRSSDPDPDIFGDSILLIYNDAKGAQLKVYDVTTHPGLYYLKNPIAGTTGTGILVAGQYRQAFGLGTHTSHLVGGFTDSYACLTQVVDLPVYRDNVKDGKLYYDPATIQKGMFEVQIHRAMPNSVTTKVWNWSAACQVFSDSGQFDEFMLVINKSHALYGGNFTYTLIGEGDLLGS